MPTTIYDYHQGADIRWYAGEIIPVPLPGAAATGRITFENGNRVQWAGNSLQFGVCFGVSAWWIIKRAQGEDFWDWFKPGRRASSSAPVGSNPGVGKVVADIRQMQISQRGKDSVIKLVDAIARVKQETGLVDRDSVSVKSGPIKDKEGFSLIVIEGTTTAAANGTDLVGLGGFNHAIAVHVISQTKVRIFDANRGEIEVSCPEEARQYINYLCTSQRQYKLTSYKLTWAAVADRRIKKGSVT